MYSQGFATYAATGQGSAEVELESLVHLAAKWAGATSMTGAVKSVQYSAARAQ